MKHKNLGEQLKRLRKQAKLTQEDAAKVIGAARTTMVAIEQDKREIKDHELRDLLRAYGVNQDQIDFAIYHREPESVLKHVIVIRDADERALILAYRNSGAFGVIEMMLDKLKRK